MERLDFSEESKYNAIEASIHLNRYLSAKKFINGKKVLDVACGEGYGTYLLKRWGASEVTGVDISEEALSVAKEKFSGEGITFVEHSAEELPFEDDLFDVVVSYETVEHLDYPEKFLSEIKRVAKKNGTIIVSCPNDPYYYKSDPIANPYHKRKYTWYDFSEMSKKYLGNDVAWYFGFATNGYMTIPQNQCKFPEKDDLDSLKMTEMLNEKYMDISSYVIPDRYINHWNANYYLGVWGQGNSESVDTVVSFPREIFIEPDDSVFADITKWNKRHKKEIKLLENKLSEEIQNREDAEQECKTIKEKNEVLEKEHQKYLEAQEEYEKNCNELADIKKRYEEDAEKLIDLTEDIRVIKIQERRTSALLEVANREKACLWERINRYEAQLKEHELQLQEKSESFERILAEKENRIGELENDKNVLQLRVDEFERYKHSISYKLMQPVRKIWDILRFWKKH